MFVRLFVRSFIRSFVDFHRVFLLNLKMVASFALLFTYLSVLSCQIWEHEIQFTGKRTIRITMGLPSNSGAETPRQNYTAVDSADPIAGTSGGEDKSSPGPLTDAFLSLIQQSNSSWQVIPTGNVKENYTYNLK